MSHSIIKDSLIFHQKYYSCLLFSSVWSIKSLDLDLAFDILKEFSQYKQNNSIINYILKVLNTSAIPRLKRHVSTNK